MSHSVLEYLDHIEQEVLYISNKSLNLSYSDFIDNESLTRAFERSLEIIGEASKKVPTSFRKEHPEVEWKKMAGMRDRLIHAYSYVDYDIVWSVIQNDIPPLRQQIKTIIEDIEENNS